MSRWLTIAAIAMAAACSNSSTGYGNTPPPPPPPAPPPGGHSTTIDVRDNSFNPTPDTVSSGATVTFNWTGNNNHNVTFEDGIGSSATQGNGSTHTRTFGTVTSNTSFRFRCTVHSTNFTSGMSGVIVVKP